MLDHHFKIQVQRYLKLFVATPAPVVFFLGGVLPASAILHLRMFSVFGQICRLKNGDNILARQASFMFSSSLSPSWSWFWKLRSLCMKYSLPHPASWTKCPPPKQSFKSLRKQAVMEYWREKLTAHSERLSSLKYLKTNYISLQKCHPIYTTCGANDFEVKKSIIQGLLISGRYRFETLTRHFGPNRDEKCALEFCVGSANEHIGDIESFFLSCKSLSPQHRYIENLIEVFCNENPDLSDIVTDAVDQNPVQFFLDCSVIPSVIINSQVNGFSTLQRLFRLTRHVCYMLHKARENLVKEINYSF